MAKATQPRVVIRNRSTGVRCPDPTSYVSWNRGGQMDTSAYGRHFDAINNLKPVEYTNDAYNHRT